MYNIHYFHFQTKQAQNYKICNLLYNDDNTIRNTKIIIKLNI